MKTRIVSALADATLWVAIRVLGLVVRLLPKEKHV